MKFDCYAKMPGQDLSLEGGHFLGEHIIQLSDPEDSCKVANTTENQRATTGYKKKLILSLNYPDGTARYINQPENSELQCLVRYDGVGEDSTIAVNFMNKYVVTYDTENNTIEIGGNGVDEFSTEENDK